VICTHDSAHALSRVLRLNYICVVKAKLHLISHKILTITFRFGFVLNMYSSNPDLLGQPTALLLQCTYRMLEVTGSELMALDIQVDNFGLNLFAFTIYTAKILVS